MLKHRFFRVLIDLKEKSVMADCVVNGKCLFLNHKNISSSSLERLKRLSNLPELERETFGQYLAFGNGNADHDLSGNPWPYH